MLAALPLLGALSCQAITAPAYIAVDLLTGTVLAEQRADDVRSIASITKLVVAKSTATLDQAELITITKSDISSGHMKSTPLRIGSTYTRKQLTELALVSSDNVAAIALGRTAPDIISSVATIVEPSGLNPANTSTARSLAHLASELYQTEVAEVTTRTVTEVGARHSTNPFLTKAGWQFFLSKTGFINDSGGCLVVITKINDKLTTVVILGASNTKQRWLDLAELRQQLGDSNFYIPIKVKHVQRRRNSAH